MEHKLVAASVKLTVIVLTLWLKLHGFLCVVMDSVVHMSAIMSRLVLMILIVYQTTLVISVVEEYVPTQMDLHHKQILVCDYSSSEIVDFY